MRARAGGVAVRATGGAVAVGRAAAVVLALVLGAATSACGALDRALDDPAVSADGGCGWSEQGFWRASLGGGATELGSDDANRRWTVLAVATETEAATDAPGAGEGGDQVRDAVLRGAFQQGWEYVEVELEGKVEVAAAGLAGRFTSTGAQAPVPDVVVEVSCGPTP